MTSANRPTGRDVLERLAREDCPVPDCGGVLVRREYKDTDALVCQDCDTPAVRVWGETE